MPTLTVIRKVPSPIMCSLIPSRAELLAKRSAGNLKPKLKFIRFHRISIKNFNQNGATTTHKISAKYLGLQCVSMQTLQTNFQNLFGSVL